MSFVVYSRYIPLNKFAIKIKVKSSRILSMKSLGSYDNPEQIPITQATFQHLFQSFADIILHYISKPCINYIISTIYVAYFSIKHFIVNYTAVSPLKHYTHFLSLLRQHHVICWFYFSKMYPSLWILCSPQLTSLFVTLKNL